MKRKKNWKLRIILTCLLIGVGYYFLKTKTSWLDDDSQTKKRSNRYEAYYITLLAKELGGEEEVRLEGGRADIVTDEYAIEVEWASKWKNAIGQSLWYAHQTNTKPKIILLVKDEKKGDRYLMMLNSVLLDFELEIETSSRLVSEME